MPMNTRRAIRLLRGIAITLGVGAGAIAAHAIAGSLALRLDITTTRAHKPLDSTLATLDQLEDDHEIVVVGSLAAQTIDPWSAQRVRDALDELDERSARLSVRWIDPASGSGGRDMLALLDRLIDRDREAIDAQRETLRSCLDAAERVTRALRDRPRAEQPTDLDQRLDASLPNADSALQITTSHLAREIEGRDLPAIAEAQAALSTLVSGYRAVGGAIAGLGLSGVEEAIAELISAAGPAMAIEPAPAATAASELTARDVVLVIGPGDVRTLEPGALFPPPPADRSVAVSADAAPRAELAVARALNDLTGTPRPLVVFVHGEAGRVLEHTPVLIAFARDLQARGYDLAEWAPVIEPDPPVAAGTDERPVIYVLIGTDAGADGDSPARTGPARAARVAQVLAALLEAGHPVLVSLPPSPLPAYGESDPMAQALGPLGVRAQTGTPILRSSVTPSGRLVVAEHELVAEGSGPIGDAVGGLRLLLPWPVALDVPDGAAPLLTYSDERAWGETSWQTYRTVPAEQRALIRNPPEHNPDLGETRGPWVLGASLERDGQRVVVIGSNRWFFDEIARASALIDGRNALVYPGNTELLHASLAWLSGRDEIAPTEAVLVPRVRALDETTLLLLRLGCGLGLPAGVLLAGVVLSLVRR